MEFRQQNVVVFADISAMPPRATQVVDLSIGQERWIFFNLQA